jgi:quinolinate synthase
LQEEITRKILDLKKKRGALILAHNYQRPEVQDIADLAGDSLDLARKAAGTDAGVIIFCGVHFMAETAAILSPEKTVILPDPGAGCPMADMADAVAVEAMKKKHPGAKVVCYVNSTAEVKAASDRCCTSANAVQVVSAIEEDVIFVPDRYLGTFAASRTGQTLHLWPGYCPTHLRILPYDIEEGRRNHPGCAVMVHPECRPEVTALADQVLSTGQMARFAAQSDAATFVVGTETGLLHRLRKENPGKTFIPATEAATCPDMKKITLETLRPVVSVPEETRRRAYNALLPLLR